MGQVLRRTIINVGIHTNGCTVCQKAPEWLGYLVSTDSFLAQCLSGDSAVVLSENKLTFQQVWDFLSFLWETNVLAASADQLWSCCGGLSYTGLGPAILWFCLSVTFFLWWECYHVWMGSVIATVEEVLEHDMQNPLKQRFIIQFIVPGVVCMIETRH